MSEQYESLGRIEVAPEVLTTIARYAVMEVPGVSKIVPATAEKSRPFRRGTRHDGIQLDMTDDNSLVFDIHVLIKPEVNIMDTSRKLQTAVAEAMDKMVGLTVAAVNIHVEDVSFAPGKSSQD